MTFLSGVAALDIDGGSPNNGRGEGNMTEVKKARVGHDWYPYVSAQAFRRWLRDSMPAEAKRSPINRQGKGKKQQAYTDGRPDLYLDDDLFGYMVAVAKDSYVRDTVFATGKFLSLAAQRITYDYGTMSRDITPDSHPLLHEHEHYTADLVGDLQIDVARVGVFDQGGSNVRKPSLSATAAREAVEAGASSTVLRGRECLALPIEERRQRLATLLRTLARVHGGASRALGYGDRSPSFILLSPLKGGNNPFTRVLTAGPVTKRDPGSTVFDVDTFREEYAAWQDELEGPVQIGWSPGFLGDQRSQALRALAEEISSGGVVIDHPRTVLNGMAKEIEAGQRDNWFSDTPN